MDGHGLLQLYEMCLINRVVMYESLKTELTEDHHKSLPITDFVNFLQKIKIYVPLTANRSKTAQPDPITSAVCSIM